MPYFSGSGVSPACKRALRNENILFRQFPLLFILFYFLAASLVYGSSWARDGIQATAVTYAKLWQHWILTSLCHNGNSPVSSFRGHSICQIPEDPATVWDANPRLVTLVPKPYSPATSVGGRGLCCDGCHRLAPGLSALTDARGHATALPGVLTLIHCTLCFLENGQNLNKFAPIYLVKSGP